MSSKAAVGPRPFRERVSDARGRRREADPHVTRVFNELCIYIYIYISFSFSSCITAIIARTCLRGILAILLERNEVMYNLAVDLGVLEREREREREWEKAIY